MVGNSARYPNRLKEAIKLAGLTIKEVADETNIPLRTLTDYCAGKVPVPRKKLEDIALVIGCSSQTLVPAIARANLVEYPEGQTYDWITTGAFNRLDKLRRDILLYMKRLTSLAGVSLLVPQDELFHPDAWERLLLTLDKSSRADNATLIHLEQLTDTYWELYRTAIAKNDLLSSVSGHLITVTRLLKTSQPIATQFRLCSIVSNAAQILGEICYDIDNLDAAKTYYDVAAKAADEVGNHALQATALGRRGFLPVYKGAPQEALPLLREASILAQGRTTGKTRAWIMMMEAEALSRIGGKERECLSVIKKVEDVFGEENIYQEKAPNKDDRIWTGFNYSTMIGYKGACFLNLNKPEEARSMLHLALEDLPSGPTRRRSLILADLAQSYIQSQEIEGACNTAMQALVRTAQSKSPRALQRLRAFQKNLRPWRNLTCVRRFNSAMHILEEV